MNTLDIKMKMYEVYKRKLEMDSPLVKTYKKEKINIKKRQTSLDILKKLREKSEIKNIEQGKIYILSYTANEVPTDKWNRICIVYVTYVSPSSFEGYNLLYFNEESILQFLKCAVKNPKHSFIREEEGILSGLLCAKKEYNLRNIKNISLIDEEFWGKLPCLKKDVFGNMNFQALEFDWKLENKTVSPAKKKAKKELKSKQEEVIESTEDIDIFGDRGATGATLFDIKRDLFDDDYDI